MRVLLLGGTAEASALARALANKGTDAIFSYAGRTRNPAHQPLPTRIGGFGGVKEMARFIHDHAITHLIDATHPFSQKISTNTIRAAARTRTPLVALERPPWTARPGDDWTRVPDATAAAVALPNQPTNVFLAIGRQSLSPFSRLPHRWLLRFVDFDATQPVPLGATLIIRRGPYQLVDDMALLRHHAITTIVAKNAGGTGTRAKLDAARELGLRVIMIDRPALPPRNVLPDIASVLAWLNA